MGTPYCMAAEWAAHTSPARVPVMAVSANMSAAKAARAAVARWPPPLLHQGRQHIQPRHAHHALARAAQRGTCHAKVRAVNVATAVLSA